MMICPSCSFENMQGADQCENCGADLRTTDIPHPGNVLEARLVHDHLSELGAEGPLSVSVGDSIAYVVRQMQTHGIGSVLVRDEDGVAGIFTERDALKKVATAPLDGRTIGEVMTRDPVMLREDDSVAVAIHKMAVGGYRHIPMLHGGEVAAIVTSRDIFRYVSQIMEHPADPSTAVYEEGLISGGGAAGASPNPGGAQPLATDPGDDPGAG